ncbi:MAG: hypothetical protein IJ038_06990 [Clostridia bacterium]|nr:hypothetical protein [Clostridia bacterium]
MREYNAAEVILNNLSELSERGAVNDEQRDISISQLASLLLSEGSPDTAYTAFAEKYGDSATAADKISFCRKICEASKINGFWHIPPLFSAELPVSAGSHEKTAFVRNRYNDMAFEKISSILPHSKAVYFSSFEEAAEAVSGGECEFTVIPVENTSDGKMFGFYSLMDRYELKICASCTLESEDSSKTISYALCSRNYRVRELEKASAKKDKIFEFCITHGSGTAPYDIFFAAALCGAGIHRISSLPLPYNDLMTRFFYSFSITEKTDFASFLFYLKSEYEEYTPIGIYFEI